MCLLITAIAALGFGCYYVLTKKSNKEALMLFLMLSAAALMWCVDGVAAKLGGECFFDLSREDAILGAVIVLVSLLFYGALEIKKQICNGEA